MSRYFFYTTKFSLRPGSDPLAIVRSWDPDAEAEELSCDTEAALWDEPNGPQFSFNRLGKTLTLTVNTEALHSFGDEFDDDPEVLARDYSTPDAIVAIERPDRHLQVYGQLGGNRRRASADYHRGVIAEASNGLAAHERLAAESES